MVTLRDAFERALEKKKKYIGGLLNELEEGEEQYSMAFRAQMENIERMMGVHQVMMMVLMMVMLLVMLMATVMVVKGNKFYLRIRCPSCQGCLCSVS